MRFKVIRQHFGDKLYMPGEERDAAESDVSHLIPYVLEKMEAAPKNKAKPRAPKNKSGD